MIKKFLQTLRAKLNDVSHVVFARILNYELVECGVEGIVSEQFV